MERRGKKCETRLTHRFCRWIADWLFPMSSDGFRWFQVVSDSLFLFEEECGFLTVDHGSVVSCCLRVVIV